MLDIRPFGRNSETVAHGAQQVSNEMGKSVPLQLSRERFQNKIARVLRDFIRNVGNGSILFGERGGRRFTGEDGEKFIGEIANLKETQRRTNLIEGALGEFRMRNGFQPFYRPLLWIARLLIGIILEGRCDSRFLRPRLKAEIA